MTVDELLGHLDGVKKRGHGWTARCPAHEDQNPSLSVSQGDDGRVLIKCFGGCAPEDVVAAVGLRMTDLFPSGNEDRRERVSMCVGVSRMKG